MKFIATTPTEDKGISSQSTGSVPNVSLSRSDALATYPRDSEAGLRLSKTVASYNAHPTHYANRYSQVDMSAYYDAFLSLRGTNDLPILDAGCGSGRDCAAFEQLQTPVVGLDLSLGLLSIAAQNTNAPLVLADMRSAPFRDCSFSGVWACASMVHLDTREFQGALSEAARLIVPSGALFLSLAAGVGQEWRPDGHGGKRWFHYYDEVSLRHLVRDAGFEVSASSTDPGVANGTWVNIFATKTKSKAD